MRDALVGTKKLNKQKSKAMNDLSTKPIEAPFKTVARDETIVNKNEINNNLQKIDIKYNPSFTQVEDSPSKIIKLKLPEKEH